MPSESMNPVPSVNERDLGYGRIGCDSRRLVGCQRGRGRAAAGGGECHRCATTSMSQWGRGRAAAGGEAARYADDTVAFSSMGPRPGGRGRRALPFRRSNATACVNGAATSRPREGLGAQSTPYNFHGQWGRGRAAAEEGRPSATDKLWPTSMGPRPGGRGRSLTLGVNEDLFLPSMGPLQTEAERYEVVITGQY